MKIPRIVRVFHPMRHFLGGLEPWVWPEAAWKRYSGSFNSSGEIWLDACSDEPSDLIDLMRKIGHHDPCTSLLGFSTKRDLGPFEVFQLRLKESVELLQETDNFANQLDCGWPFPILRVGVTGCCRGDKKRTRPFRFAKRQPGPRNDLFEITPGPRLSNAYFGISRRAFEMLSSALLSGFVARPILSYEGDESGFFEVEVSTMTSKPLVTPGMSATKVCNVCGLHQVVADHSVHITSIGPLADVFAPDDIQVCTRQLANGIPVFEDSWRPFVSRTFIRTVEDAGLTGLLKGAAGGAYEPVITAELASLLGVRSLSIRGTGTASA